MPVRNITPNRLIECPEPGILFTRDNAAWAYHALKAVRENGQSIPEQDELCDELASILFPEPEAQPEPGLREHIAEFHPRLRGTTHTLAMLAGEHAGEHFRFGSTTHHHGPNAGPHARPEGWRTGKGVVRITPGQGALKP